MVVLFIVAVAGAIALLYYWSQTVSAARRDLDDQRRLAAESEGRTQYLVDETRMLWGRLLALEPPLLAGDRHRLALELHLILPYLWQTPPNPFYVNELKLKAEPLVRAIDDPVVSGLWARATLESISKIPTALVGQIAEPDYDPEKGVVRQPDKWYPDSRLWPQE